MMPAKFKSVSDPIAEDAAHWHFRRGSGLSSEERSAFTAWCEADPRHAAAFGEIDRAWAVLDRPLVAGRSSVVLEQLGARARRRRQRRVAAVTGGCLALVAIGMFWRTRPMPAMPAVAQVSIVAPATRTLADGSVVQLRPGADISVNFDGATRAIVLRRGEAHFQVAHAAKPFVVTAGAVEFRAVGTAFSVELGEKVVELLVTEGRVAVDQPTPDARAGAAAPGAIAAPATTATIATVDAGPRLELATRPPSIAAVAAPTIVSAEDIAEQLSWRIPRIDFTRTPLAEAVRLMNRHPRIQMTIDDATLGDLPVSGLFRAVRMEAFVGLLESNFGVEAETSAATIRLRRRR